MDGLGQLGSIIGATAAPAAAPTPTWQKLLLSGLFGAGEVGNIMADKQRSDYLKQQTGRETQYSNYVMSLLQNPQLLAQKAAATAKPLDNALVQAINNTVQGDLAQRGLAQAPGIFAATESQALAPYVQQNYNTALQSILQTLGLARPDAPNTNLLPQATDQSGTLALLMRAFQGGSVPRTATPISVPSSTGPGITFPSPPGDAPTVPIPDWDPNWGPSWPGPANPSLGSGLGFGPQAGG